MESNHTFEDSQITFFILNFRFVEFCEFHFQKVDEKAYCWD